MLRNETTEALNYQVCRLYYIDHNIYIDKSMYNTRAGGSCVIRPKMSNIPGPAGLLLRVACIQVFSYINEVIRPVIQVLLTTRVLNKVGITCAYLFDLGSAEAPSRLLEMPGS